MARPRNRKTSYWTLDTVDRKQRRLTECTATEEDGRKSVTNRNDRQGKPETNDEIVLRFKALPSDVPWANRVRKLLKLSLRCFRLRCTGIEKLPADEPNEKRKAG
jgi:hypothetical protein